jgi:hypothetical protein
MAKKQIEKTTLKEEEKIEVTNNYNSDIELDNTEIDTTIPEVNNIPIIELNNIPVNQNSNNFDPYISLSNLIFYSKELLLSLEGIYLGGYANQKRDQLISNIDKLETELRDSE